MSSVTGLGPGPEFDAIRQLVERWGVHASGIGDDAAILHVPRGDVLLASVDSVVEGRHFRAAWLTPREVGYRAVAAALSDLAAMAAKPIGVLVAIVVPAAWRDRLAGLADGIGDAVGVAHTHICGGNLSGGDELSITTTVLGHALTPLRRSDACAGEFVYVTGRFGAPGAALSRLNAGAEAAEYRDRFARPVPRLHEAQWLADRGASAGIDVSDGLVSDLRHLAVASGVGIRLDAGRVPVVNGVETEEALRSGEEYELIVTAPDEFDVAEFQRRFGLSLTRVGTVDSLDPGIVRVSGATAPIGPGYDHFSS